MKIIGGMIDVFKPFSKLQLPDLSRHNVVLFHGPNGCGKSSLFTFIQYVLFGWETGSVARRKNPAFRDKAQGQLILSDSSGVVSTKFRDVKSAKPERDYSNQLSEELYRSRFVINLNVLTQGEADISKMMEDMSRGVLDWAKYRSFTEELKKRKDEIYKKQARTGAQLNAALILRDEKEREITRLESQRGGERYNQLYEEVCKLADLHTQVKSEKNRINNELREIAELRGIAANIRKYTICKAALNGTPLDDSDKTEAWLVAFEEMENLGRREPALEEAVAAAQNQLKLLVELPEPTPDETAFLENAERLREIHRTAEDALRNNKLVQDLQKEHSRQLLEYQEGITRLGHSSFVKVIIQLPPPVMDWNLEQKLKDYSMRFDDAEKSKDLAYGDFRNEQRNAEDADRDINRRMREWSSSKSYIKIVSVLVCVLVLALFGFGVWQQTFRTELTVAGTVAMVLLGIPLALLNREWLRRRSEIQEDQQRAGDRLSESERMLGVAQGRRADLHEEFRQWVSQELSFEGIELGPAAVLELLKHMEQLRQNRRKMEETLSSCEVAQAGWEAWVGKIDLLTDDLKKYFAEDPVEWPGKISELVEIRLRSAEIVADRYRKYCDDRKALERSLEHREQALNDMRKNRRDFLDRMKSLTCERAREWKETYEFCRKIESEYGQTLGDSIERVLGVLKDDDGMELEKEQKGKLQALDSEYDELTARLTLLRKEMKDLESSDEIANCIIARNSADALAQSAYDEYLTLCIAEQLLQTACENSHPSEAWLAKAGELAKIVTDGEWVKFEERGGRVELFDSKGRMLANWAHLSRGTAEQIYLAMRFAFACCYAETSEPMPIILDDVMVNFDDAGRTTAALRAVREIASDRQQIMMFTCHEHFVQTAHSVLGESALYVAMDQCKRTVEDKKVPPSNVDRGTFHE